MGVATDYLYEITAKIKKDADKACQLVAKETGEEIQEAFVESVRDFYSSYSPSSYRRTRSTYEASSGKHGKKHWRIGEMHFGFGIRVDPSYMNEPYNVGHHGWAKYGLATASFIFGRTWDQGIHGFMKREYVNTNKFRSGYGIEKWDLDIYDSEGTHLVNSAKLWAYRKKMWEKDKKKYHRLPSNSTPPGLLMDHKTKVIWSTVPAKVDKYFSL